MSRKNDESQQLQASKWWTSEGVRAKAPLIGGVALAATLTLSAVVFGITKALPALRRVNGVPKAKHQGPANGEPSASSSSEPPTEPGISEDDPRVLRRRAAILSKPIILPPPPSTRDSVASSTDSTSSFDTTGAADYSASDDDDKLTPTRNLKLYHYYDVEIKGGRGNGNGPGGVPLLPPLKEYEKTGYLGYSSYQPTADADRQYFKQPAINVKRLSDWNRRFQDCIAKLKSFTLATTLQARMETNLEMLHLAQDFIYAATTYGKIIISEYYLPLEKKTIKPCSLPGLMGGQKYIVQNILFKFAVDYNELFGNDSAAAKAAGNELRGLISYFNCGIPELNVPLMTLVDYRGFRLIAMSILPVSPETIIYGSCDAGRHIHATDDFFNEKMKNAAHLLNLKPHHWKVASAEGLNAPPTPTSTEFKNKRRARHPGYYEREKEDSTDPTAKTGSEGNGVPTSISNVPAIVVSAAAAMEEPSATKESDRAGLTSSGHIYSQMHSSVPPAQMNSINPLVATTVEPATPTKVTLKMPQEQHDLLYSPADLEGHRGFDGKYYLLDYSRTMPPETPCKNFKNSHLWRVLRPEFVQGFPKPLCSDAFSGFIKGDDNEFDHNQEIREASQHLTTVTVPKFAATLRTLMQEAKHQNRLNDFRITETIHTVGINCRHMGILRTHIDKPEFKQMILAEAVARVIKNNLRFKLRGKMQLIKLPLEEPYRRAVIDYMNLVFGSTKESDEYWDNWLKKDLQMNFTDMLTEEEKSVDFHLKVRNVRQLVDKHFLIYVFDRVKRMMGFVLSDRSINFQVEQPFDYTDLESIGERVKHMNIVAHAQGFFYHLKGLTIRVEDPLSAKKFYEMAMEKFREALDSNPNNKEILLSIALTSILSIEEDFGNVPNAKFSREDPRVRQAEEYSLRAISAEPKYDSFSLFRYAQFLERCNRLEDAEDYYLQALEADPNNTGALHSYGTLLSDSGLHDIAEKFYSRSSKTTVGFKHRPEYYY